MDSIEQLGKFGREQLIDLSLLALEGNEPDPVSYIPFVHGLVAVVADCLREVPALKPIDIVLDIIENAAKGGQYFLSAYPRFCQSFHATTLAPSSLLGRV